MSEISITRFQPAIVARDKVNSVQAVEEDVGLDHAQDPPKDAAEEQQKQQQEQERRQTSSATRKKSAPLKASPYENMAETEPESTDSDPADDSIEHAVSRLNEYVQSVKRDIIFDFDPDSGEPSVTVVDRESRKILRQFDRQEAVELARTLDKQEPLSLFKTQV